MENNNHKISTIFKQAEASPYKLNLEGKKNLVMELTEFMLEKQLDGIINQMKDKYARIEKNFIKKEPLKISEKTKKVVEQARKPEFTEQEMDAAQGYIKK